MTRKDAKEFLDNIKQEELGRCIGASEFYSRLIGYHVQALNMAIEALEQEPKTGHWILTDDDIFVYCSECEDSYYQRPIDASWHYCPNCGAKMVEPMESEE